MTWPTRAAVYSIAAEHDDDDVVLTLVVPVDPVGLLDEGVQEPSESYK